MTNAEIRKLYRGLEIQKIENKYGLARFRMALVHLFDVGYKHITDESVEKAKQQIMQEAEPDTSGGISIMTPAFQCQLLDITLELTRFSLSELLAYVKTDYNIG